MEEGGLTGATFDEIHAFIHKVCIRCGKTFNFYLSQHFLFHWEIHKVILKKYLEWQLNPYLILQKRFKFQQSGPEKYNTIQ